MELAIVERPVGDAVVLDIMGQMRAEEGPEAVFAHVRRCVGARHRALLLNLREVPYADSTGITELLRSRQLVEEMGGIFLLVDVQPHVLRLLQESGLLAVFTTFDDEGSAIADVRQRRGG